MPINYYDIENYYDDSQDNTWKDFYGYYRKYSTRQYNDNFIEYFSYNTEKSLNIVCLASCDEFYKSTNDTAKELLNLEENADVADFKTDDLNLHPIMISQIGIHDSDGNLLAICKPNQPIKKYWHDILSFNIKIRI